MSNSAVTFGPLTFDPASSLLRSAEGQISLGQRAAALLQVLITADHQPVTKSALLDAAWPGMVVEDGNLTVQIAALRKALGTRPDGQDWIITVPRVGYRLIADSHSDLPAVADLPLIAVLPFQNLGDDPAQGYFADGVVEDITTALSRFRSFAVISRNSSFTYKGRSVDARQAAAELGVRYLLQGSLRRAGKQLRIVAQLVDGNSGTQLWAQTYDGTAGQVFAFQDRITESVVAVIEPQIRAAELQRIRRENHGSVTAYEHYLRARQGFEPITAGRLAAAQASLDLALAIERENATYLALYAHVRQIRLGFGWEEPTPNKRRELINLTRQALSLAGSDAEVMARCALSLVHIHDDYDWVQIMARSALDTNPNSISVIISAAIVELHCGSVARAVELLERALALSPRDPMRHATLCGLAHCRIVTGDYDQALDRATEALAASTNYDPTWWMLIAANVHLGRMEAARAALARFTALSPDVTIASIRAGQPKKDPGRIEPILEGLRLAGLPET